LAYGSLALRRLRLRAGGTRLAALVSVKDKDWPAFITSDGAHVSADLGDGLSLTAGETLLITLTLEPAARG
jgi:hypothetical protein